MAVPVGALSGPNPLVGEKVTVGGTDGSASVVALELECIFEDHGMVRHMISVGVRGFAVD